MHGLFTYIAHYLVASSIFRLLNPHGMILWILLLIGVLFTWYLYRKRRYKYAR